MMRHSNIEMKTTVKRVELLVKVKENAEKHAAIVAEARIGYVMQARVAVEKKLKELQAGKIVSLHFTLNPPVDHTEVYKTTIEMLEWNTEELVILEADEFRQLVQDQWDWSSSFYGTNKVYSSTADAEAAVRGY